MHLHDTVELTRDVEQWPAGTSAVIVDESPDGPLLEIVGPDGRTLALLDVQPEDIRLLERPAQYAATA